MSHEIYVEVQRYARVLLDRKRILVFVALLAMSAGVVVSYVLPKTYEAKATIFIEQSVINDLVKGIAITPSMQAKIRVLSLSMLSRETLTKVLRILDKDVVLTTDNMREQYMQNLRKRIAIRLDERRGVVFISFTDKDPRFARDLVNTISQVYIEENTAAKRDESLEATRFLAEQIETFKKRIDVVQEEINQYRIEHGLQLTVDEGMIRFEVSEAEKRIDALRMRQRELDTQLRLISGGAGGGALQELESQLAMLLTTYTESHPKVIRLKAQIEAVRSRPGSAAGSDSGGVSRALIRAEMESNAQRIAKQEELIEDRMQLLRQIPALRTGLNELNKKKENETVIYNQLLTRYGQSEVSKQMEMENKSMTFRIVDAAVLPEKPISPKRVLIMLGALAVGLGAGAVLIILPYMIRGSVRSLDALRQLNYRVLAVVPAIPKTDEVRNRRRADVAFLSISMVYFALLLSVVTLEALGKPYVETLIRRVMAMWS